MQGVLLSPLPAAEAVPPRSPLLPPLRRIQFLPGEGGGVFPSPLKKGSLGILCCAGRKRENQVWQILPAPSPGEEAPVFGENF